MLWIFETIDRDKILIDHTSFYRPYIIPVHRRLDEPRDIYTLAYPSSSYEYSSPLDFDQPGMVFCAGRRVFLWCWIQRPGAFDWIKADRECMISGWDGTFRVRSVTSSKFLTQNDTKRCDWASFVLSVIEPGTPWSNAWMGETCFRHRRTFLKKCNVTC